MNLQEILRMSVETRDVLFSTVFLPDYLCVEITSKEFFDFYNNPPLPVWFARVKDRIRFVAREEESIVTNIQREAA